MKTLKTVKLPVKHGQCILKSTTTWQWHNKNVMYSTENRHIWATNESRDVQLYNDSFLILIGRVEAELRHF